MSFFHRETDLKDKRLNNKYKNLFLGHSLMASSPACDALPQPETSIPALTPLQNNKPYQNNKYEFYNILHFYSRKPYQND